MLHIELNASYSDTLLETLSILNSYSLGKFLWKKYEKFAIPKIERSTIQLRGTFYNIESLTPIQAQKELKELNQISPFLFDIKAKIEIVNDPDFHKFKKVVMNFFSTFEDIDSTLNEIADVNFAYKASMPVLALDWDSEEDNHWDNY